MQLMWKRHKIQRGQALKIYRYYRNLKMYAKKYQGFHQEGMLAQGQTQGSMLQECTNKTLTTDPFNNTCEVDEVSPEVEAGVVARLRCLQPQLGHRSVIITLSNHLAQIIHQYPTLMILHRQNRASQYVLRSKIIQHLATTRQIRFDRSSTKHITYQI